MFFSGIIFIAYFLPVTIAVYYLLRFSRSAQNLWLLSASLIFYAWGEPIFVFIILFLILLNYLMLLAIYRTREKQSVSLALTATICAFNLAVLFACKHLFGIISGVSHFIAPEREIIPYMTVPVGISFFTLRVVSYAIDVYKGSAQPPGNPINAALYIAFFPTLIAGPVMHYSDINEQIVHRKESWQGFSAGACGFITGLAKQVLLGANMAVIADHIFSYSAMSNEITQVPALMAWLGAIAFALQIYFDLSGYSDMAVGLGRMFGFELKENFDYPYASLSMSEFWSKWNITLMGWFREYIYFPLGGSLVKNNDKMVRNIFITWLFIGIWHGAKWTFILWAIWQFIFVVFERVIAYEKRSFPVAFRRLYVLSVILCGCVIFRTDNIYQATLYFSNMLGLNHNGFFSDTALMFIREYWVFIVAGILFSTPVARRLSDMISGERAGKWGAAFSAAYPALMIASFYIAVAYIIRGSAHPFIYFRL